MKFEIEIIETGYLLIIDDKEKYAYEDLSDVLSVIGDMYETSSRHDAERIYIIKAPGDKHPDFTEAHSKVIFGEG